MSLACCPQSSFIFTHTEPWRKYLGSEDAPELPCNVFSKLIFILLYISSWPQPQLLTPLSPQIISNLSHLHDIHHYCSILWWLVLFWPPSSIQSLQERGLTSHLGKSCWSPLSEFISGLWEMGKKCWVITQGLSPGGMIHREPENEAFKGRQQSPADWNMRTLQLSYSLTSCNAQSQPENLNFPISIGQ